MRKIVPVLVAVGLIILIAVGFVGFQVLDRYMPTKERADLAEVYDVSGDETAILYNYERQEQTGIYENGQTYLPVSWVNDHINERFYWDSTEDLLVYALPDQIVYADAETKGANGVKAAMPRGMIIQVLAAAGRDAEKTRSVAPAEKQKPARKPE